MDQLNNAITGKPISVSVQVDINSAIYLGAGIFLAIVLGIALGAAISK